MTEPWIQTYTGRAFDLLDPQQHSVDIADIAHSLARQCRFNGHCQFFYSVAQHSVLIAQWLRRVGASPKTQLYGLLHDAPEAYVGDMPRPLKKLLPEFRDIETRVAVTVLKRFGLRLIDIPHEVHLADARILLDERKALMGLCQRAWTGMDGLEPLGVVIEPWLPGKATDAFLTMYVDLQEAVHA